MYLLLLLLLLQVFAAADDNDADEAVEVGGLVSPSYCSRHHNKKQRQTIATAYFLSTFQLLKKYLAST